MSEEESLFSTDLDDLEVRDTIKDYWDAHPIHRSSFDLESLQRYLLNRLKSLPRSQETTRPIQTYWTMAPLFQTYRMQDEDPLQYPEIQELKQLVIESFDTNMFA